MKLNHVLTHSGIVIVKVNAWVIGRICSRKCDQWARYASATSSDLDLPAGNKELRTPIICCIVHPQVLDTQEVLAIRRILRDREGIPCKAYYSHKSELDSVLVGQLCHNNSYPAEATE
jgi:hypothetical protein